MSIIGEKGMILFDDTAKENKLTYFQNILTLLKMLIIIQFQ